MKIKKIELKNGYKRFNHLTIDLGEKPAKIVALVGANGSGKSSIFDGMLFLHNAHGKIGDTQARTFEYHSMNKQPGFDYRNVTVLFESGDYQTVRKELASQGKDKAMFSFRSPHRHNGNLKISQSKALPGILQNNYGASYSSDIDQKMEQNYRRLFVKYNQYLEEKDCKPSEAKKHIIGQLNDSLENCLDLKITSIGNIEASEGTLYFEKKDHPSKFEYNVLSSGEKEVVDLILDLYLRQDEYSDSVFIIDEPELHLNTSIQRKLLIEINKLIGPKCQLWVATHSIGFLRALQEELKDHCQIIYFDSDRKWASEPQTLRPMNKTRYNWVKIFETALDDLSGLVSPKQIFYCEGKDKPAANGAERGLDAKVFNNIFSEQYHDTVFVSSGGNTELDQRSQIGISLLSKVFTDLKINVLKDRDMASGKVTSENDRQVYLNTNLENHRVLKRWEIENYLYDKEVLLKYCSENSLTFNEGKYDLLVTDIVNQDVKSLTSQIRSICGISGSINPESFKIQLSQFICPDMETYKELESCIFERA